MDDLLPENSKFMAGSQYKKNNAKNAAKDRLPLTSIDTKDSQQKN
jgi:hypothetical protein